MLGQPAVEPEHLLLAFARRGSVEPLLSKAGVGASDIHAEIARRGGLGDDLVLGRVPRSPAADAALERSVAAAAVRGVLGPSSEHVLLGLRDDARVAAVLRGVGITDAEQLVDATYPVTRAPLRAEQVESYRLRVGTASSPPQPGPGPPVFERFTAEAQHAIRAAVESAAILGHPGVEPFHLMLGCLQVPDSLAGRVLAAELPPSQMGALGEAMQQARTYGPDPAHQATGIFADTTRQIVAEDALKQAYRRDHHHIGTGHLLLATLDSHDRTAERIIGTAVTGSEPVCDRIAREVVQALPGNERPLHDVDHSLIQIDHVINVLAGEFAKIVPAGWAVRVAARSSAMTLTVPGSRSEEDFRIDLGWIVACDGPAQPRLLNLLRSALESLQADIASHAGRPWPTSLVIGQDRLHEVHAAISGDENPTLRIWYGEGAEPVLELTSPTCGSPTCSSTRFEQRATAQKPGMTTTSSHSRNCSLILGSCDATQEIVPDVSGCSSPRPVTSRRPTLSDLIQ
jgi:hypothetical protein